MIAITQTLKRWRAPLLGLLTGMLLSTLSGAEQASVDIVLEGASGRAQPIGSNDTTPPSHFLAQARTVFDHAVGISGFSSLGSFQEVYPGINMACYGDEHHFEYSFLLRAGADPSKIQIKLKGVKTEGISDQGDIVYSGKGFEAYQHAPALFRVDQNGTHPSAGRLAYGEDGQSSIAMERYSDEHRDELNNSRFNIVSAASGHFGPDYDFFMSKYETTNEQLIRFLNDAEANKSNPRGENMFFDKQGRVWLNPAMHPNRDEMFLVASSKLQYDPDRVSGDRYHHTMDEHGREPFANHPAVGVSWYGSVKYCNWLTIQAGRGLHERCYTEGTNAVDWAPATATNWSNGFFSASEREAWLKSKGFRLPMLRLQDPSSNSDTNRFNEFLKAGAWMGNTNVTFGYGRNTFTNQDANVLATAMAARVNTLPVGYFDGLNPLFNSRTRPNENYYGIHDLSGNVSEWVNDPPRAGVPDARSACGGSFEDRLRPLPADQIVAPSACGAFGGFRTVTTFMPDEYSLVHVLFCFHSSQGIPEALQKRFGTQFDPENRKQDASKEPLNPTGGGSGGDGLSGGDEGEVADAVGLLAGDEGESETIPPQLDDDPDPDNETQPTPPGIIYTEDDDDDEDSASGDSGGGGDDVQDGGGGGRTPFIPPPPPPPPPPPTYRLGVSSQNPDSGVNIAVSVNDVNGNADGASTFERFYFFGEQVTLNAPQTVGDNVFQYWLRNSAPFSTSPTITVQMLSDLNVKAVYLSPVPPLQRTLNVNSTAPTQVPVSISITDNNGNQDGGTTFSRIYDDGDTVTATAPTTHDGEDVAVWLRNGLPFSDGPSVTVTMFTDITLTATYGRPQDPGERMLTVDSQNPDSDVPISVSQPDNDGLQNGSSTFQRLYNKDTPVTLVAPTTADGKTFSHWLSNGSLVSTDPSVTVTLTTDMTMTAVYADAPVDIRLIVKTDPVSGVPIAIGTPDNSGSTDGSSTFTRFYDSGTTTTVTAPSTISSGTLIFKNWTMNGTPYSTDPSLSIELLVDTELIAVYRPEDPPESTYDLFVKSQGAGSGVDITVSTPDTSGDSDGNTGFDRTYNEGAETTLTAPETAPNGKVFDYWIVDGARYSSNNSINIAMYSDHTVTAVYRDEDPRYLLTVESRNPNSSIVVSVDPIDVNGQQNGSTTFTRLYDDGEVVTLTARDPAFPGSPNTLKQWLLDGTPISTNATITVTMYKDTTVTAVYGTPIPETDKTLTVQSENPNGGVNIAISATDLNGAANGSTTFDRLYTYGTPVTATAPAIAPDGNEFQHWLLDGNIYSTDLSVDVLMLGDITLTAVYATPAIEHVLSVNSRNPGSGVGVQVSTVDNGGNQNGSTDFDRLYGDGVGVTLVAPGTAPNGRDVFKGWERDGFLVTTNTTVDLTMFSDIDMTAVYGPPSTFDLTVNSENPASAVNVTISTPDIRGDTDGNTAFLRTYNPGEHVTLTAEEISGDGTVFKEWLRNGQPHSSDRSIDITMLSDVEMTAVYGPPPGENRWLTVRSQTPSGNEVVVGVTEDQRNNGAGETSFIRLYRDGDTVTVSAPPTSNGDSFRQWILDGSPYSTNPNETIVMNQDHELIAVYGPPDPPEARTLVVDSRNPNSGVPIDVSNSDIYGDGDGDTVFVRTYTYGDSTTLTAPEQGGTNTTEFLYWEMNGTRFSNDRTVTVTMLTDLHMTAVYGDAPVNVILTVKAKDDENDAPISGVVVSVAPIDLDGLTTGSTEFQREYETGQTATLTAPQTANEKEFKYWERDGTPMSTNQTVNVELLTDVTMTAVYGPISPDEELTLTVRSVGPDGSLITIIPTTPDIYANAGGSTTFERFYNTGTGVTLTAPATSNGLNFDHWEVGGATVTQDQALSLQMLSDVTVTAVYVDPPLSPSGL